MIVCSKCRVHNESGLQYSNNFGCVCLVRIKSWQKKLGFAVNYKYRCVFVIIISKHVDHFNLIHRFGHQDTITAIDSLTRQRAITAGGRDGSVRIWKVVEESQLVFHGHR